MRWVSREINQLLGLLCKALLVRMVTTFVRCSLKETNRPLLNVMSSCLLRDRGMLTISRRRSPETCSALSAGLYLKLKICRHI
jgi:hypothetical protein